MDFRNILVSEHREVTMVTEERQHLQFHAVLPLLMYVNYISCEENGGEGCQTLTSMAVQNHVGKK